MRTVYLVLSCDTDPDRPGFLDGPTNAPLTWRGMTEGIPAVKQLVRGVSDSAGREPVFTWFLRADEQMQRVYGDYAAIARTQHALLRSLAGSGDELGWHPHFWRREGDNGRWFQEVEDIEWQLDMLRQAHRDLAAVLPGGPQSVRMGWAYHNTRSYGELEALGLHVDCSALPGYRTYRGSPPTRGENYFDWHATPRQPFRPSRADHRRPPRATEGAFRLLEAPSYMASSLPWSLVSGVQLGRKTGDFGLLWDAVRRPTYCINVTARAMLFAPLVAELRRAMRRPGTDPILFSTQFHADELVPNRSRLYRIHSLRENIEALVRACHEADTRVEFVQALRIPALWAGSV
ncbi:MAG TPA: hypothetical protein VMH88_07450 [Gemmatimonadales bacterium]|nr:hypothetical protein [Gemmatimonadales bacterium]